MTGRKPYVAGFNPANGFHLFERVPAIPIVEFISKSFNPANGFHLFES